MTGPSRDLLVGIDGGGSKTLLRLATTQGTVLAEARGGPANVARDPAGAAHAIRAPLDDALAAAGLAGEAVRLHVGAGLAGALVPGAAEALRRNWADPRVVAFELCSDAQTTCLGAHAGRDGAVLAIGTGSVGFAMVAGMAHRAGGWGFPQGDEGGGAWLGLEAVRETLRVRDGRAPGPTPLTRAIEARAPDGRLPGWASRATPGAFAELAPGVFRAARDGDTFAAALVRCGAAEIAALADALPQGLPCCLLGGLAADYATLLPEGLRQRLVPPAGDAADGALSIAARLWAVRQGA